jgi:hypothetical protein
MPSINIVLDKSCEPSMSKAVNDIQAGHHFSEQDDSDKALPPPNRFKKDRAKKISFDPEHLTLIQAYKRAHRRAAVELELSRSPSSSLELNADDWRPIFLMRTVLRDHTGTPTIQKLLQN